MDDVPPSTTLILRFLIKLSSQLPSVVVKPMAGSVAKRLLCQTWSKVFEIPRATTRVFSVSRVLFEVTYIRMLSVDQYCLYPHIAHRDCFLINLL